MKTKKVLMGMLIIVFLALLILAADSYRVIAGGAIVEIDEWTFCRNVDNNCALDLFVPTKTSTEWTLFRTYYPSGCCIVTDDCVECSISADCVVLYPDCAKMLCIDGFCCNIASEPPNGCPPPCII